MRLPPLNAVRVFEAAGRHHNFSRAAVELGVTPSAVSRQIRNLEDHLGLKLFLRVGTEVQLTAEGDQYHKSIQEVLRDLETATQQLGASQAVQPLHIWGSRFFLRLWLMPRLPSFHQTYPDQEVMIASAGPSDPMPSTFDVAVRLGGGNWPGFRAELLIRRSLVPVCSPAFLQCNPAINTPEDLAHAMLLQTPLEADEWEQWYSRTGAPPVPLLHRMTFTSTDLAYSAAIDGLGIVLGRRGILEGDVKKGHLVLLFDQDYETKAGFYLIYKERHPMPERITRFRSWIFEQLAAEPK